ncbi:MAG: hypothetical protein WAT47_05470 [Nostocoides sp.]|nr:hypothetical protein [Tetrasphaera sp.]
MATPLPLAKLHPMAVERAYQGIALEPAAVAEVRAPMGAATVIHDVAVRVPDSDQRAGSHIERYDVLAQLFCEGYLGPSEVHFCSSWA